MTICTNSVDCSNIHVVNIPKPKENYGFCVDIGAPRSVIGKLQLNLLLLKIGKKFIPRMKSITSFRFGHVTVRSVGKIEMSLKTPASIRSISVLMDIVPVDIPALLGLDVLDGESLYADNVTNRLVHRCILSRPGEPLEYEDRWSVPLSRHDNHLYAQMEFPDCTFYNIAQLKNMHRQFAHPSAEKL